ncbi:hypothetical protein AXF42_Ash003678 [Apostasia shenzhenica]|uniref:Response regulatory domain-containing protein n=1 Tax=Apostasia shenzhenica TaxID=1088818 RepID=A0A2I0AHK9_9ASPA|nr:hypothetical protein AXF42_Ash003678 [Apostasia shenzhenica]
MLIIRVGEAAVNTTGYGILKSILGDREDSEQRIRRLTHGADLGSSAGRQTDPLRLYIKACGLGRSPLFANACRMSSVRGGSVVSGEGQREVHILAVDDSSVDRALVAQLLRSSKYRG